MNQTKKHWHKWNKKLMCFDAPATLATCAALMSGRTATWTGGSLSGSGVGGAQ